MLTQQQIEKYFEKSGSSGTTIHYDLKYDYFDNDDQQLCCTVNGRHNVLCISVDIDGTQWIHTEERGQLQCSPGAEFTFSKITTTEEDVDI